MDAFGIWQKPSRTSQLHSKSADCSLQLLVFCFWHFQFYSGTLVSLLGTCGEQVMCWRYSCQNGYAILAQVLPLWSKHSKNPPTTALFSRIAAVPEVLDALPETIPAQYKEILLLSSSWPGWRQMGIAPWKTWPTDGPLSPRPGTMHQQTSNSAIRTVEGPLSHKRRPTTWQWESHSEASPATAGNRWTEPWPCGPSGTHADRNATGNSLGAPLWQKADPPDLDDGGPASNSTAGRPRLGCPVEETVQALCTGWGWLDCQQIHHLSTTGPGWETHQDIQEGDSRWMGKGGRRRDTEATNYEKTVGAHAPGLQNKPPHGHPLLSQHAQVEHHSRGLRRLVPVVLGEGHCGPETATQWTSPSICREKRVVRDPQLGLRGDGPQRSHVTTTTRHPILYKGGLWVSGTAERTQRLSWARLPDTTGQVQGTSAFVVASSATVEQTKRITQRGQDQRGHGIWQRKGLWMALQLG